MPDASISLSGILGSSKSLFFYSTVVLFCFIFSVFYLIIIIYYDGLSFEIKADIS